MWKECSRKVFPIPSGNRFCCGVVLIFFFQLPLALFAVSLGTGEQQCPHSRREQRQGTRQAGGNLCSTINSANPDTAPVTIKIPPMGILFHKTNLAWPLPSNTCWNQGKWKFPDGFLSLPCFPVGGISLPPSLFLLQCRKNLFMREITENKS